MLYEHLLEILVAHLLELWVTSFLLVDELGEIRHLFQKLFIELIILQLGLWIWNYYGLRQRLLILSIAIVRGCVLGRDKWKASWKSYTGLRFALL